MIEPCWGFCPHASHFTPHCLSIWIISNLVDRILREKPHKGRKERQIPPQASAGCSSANKKLLAFRDAPRGSKKPSFKGEKDTPARPDRETDAS